MARAALVHRLNDALAAQSTRGMFATSWCGLVRSVPGGIECVHACAGHPAPLRAGNGRAAFVEVQSGPPIGIAPGMEYPSSRIVLAPSEIVCLYTDGVTEGRDPDGQEYGTERLRRLAEAWKGNAKSSAESVITDAKGFWNGAPQRDDVTLLLFGPKPR